MKKIFCYLTVLFISLLAFNGCRKMDSKYKQYIVPGGETYTGKANLPNAYAGQNRIKIFWLRGADPNIKKAMVFWNNYIDSVEVNIPPTGDTISVIIENLPEKVYTFIIKTYDSKGISSVPVQLLRPVYGERYQASLMSRPIRSSTMDAQGIVTIQWMGADISNGAYATQLTYTNNMGVTKMLRFGFDIPSTIIPDFKDGTTFQYRTVYLPDTLAIDTFYTALIDVHVSKKIAKTNWIATADSYTPTSMLPSGPAKCIIDDNITTFWHSLYPSTTVIYPHWLAVDMKQTVNVGSVELVYRTGVSNSFTDFMVQGSMDGLIWTTYGTFTFQVRYDPQIYALPGSPAMKYVRLYLIKGVNAYASLAELTVYGY